MIKFSAPLEPVPFPRPASNGRRRFNPPRYTAFKESLGTFARLAMQGRAPLSGAVNFSADFFKTRPKSPTSRNWGDLDNHIKAVLDALNGVAFEDDRQVTVIRATKNYGAPRIEIELQEVSTS